MIRTISKHTTYITAERIETKCDVNDTSKVNITSKFFFNFISNEKDSKIHFLLPLTTGFVVCQYDVQIVDNSMREIHPNSIKKVISEENYTSDIFQITLNDLLPNANIIVTVEVTAPLSTKIPNMATDSSPNLEFHGSSRSSIRQDIIDDGPSKFRLTLFPVFQEVLSDQNETVIDQLSERHNPTEMTILLKVHRPLKSITSPTEPFSLSYSNKSITEAKISLTLNFVFDHDFVIDLEFQSLKHNNIENDSCERQKSIELPNVSYYLQEVKTASYYTKTSEKDEIFIDSHAHVANDKISDEKNKHHRAFLCTDVRSKINLETDFERKLRKMNVQDDGCGDRLTSTDSYDVYQSSNMNSLRAFYDGDLLEKRILELRKTSSTIRQNWSNYSNYMDNLIEFLMNDVSITLKSKDQFSAPVEEAHSKLIKILKEHKFEWDVPDEDQSFPLIHLYTENPGSAIFSCFNRDIFRDANLDSKRMMTCRFIVELICIEMYNMCLLHPRKQNFKGMVYRGMAVEPHVIEDHYRLMQQPPPVRFIGIPDSLMSSSLNESRARAFMHRAVVKNNLKLETGKQYFVPMMLCIEIIEVRPDLLALYRQRFPHRVVNTCTAVPIADYSFYPREDEVLISGAFIQGLRVEEAFDSIFDIPYTKVDLMIINATRNHISNDEQHPSDDLARQLIQIVYRITRFEYGADYCRKRGDMQEDLDKYEKLIEEANCDLKKFIAEHGTVSDEKYTQ